MKLVQEYCARVWCDPPKDGKNYSIPLSYYWKGGLKNSIYKLFDYKVFIKIALTVDQKCFQI